MLAFMCLKLEAASVNIETGSLTNELERKQGVLAEWWAEPGKKIFT